MEHLTKIIVSTYVLLLVSEAANVPKIATIAFILVSHHSYMKDTVDE